VPKVLIVYITRSGDTANIAERIAEGIRFEGLEAETAEVNTIKNETDLNGFAGDPSGPLAGAGRPWIGSMEP
jgi:flavodoxin